MDLRLLTLLSVLHSIQSWVPPGMSEHAESVNHDHIDQQKDMPAGHGSHHDHSDNIDMVDLVTDTEHMVDDLEWYTKSELETMNVDEKVFTWFAAHDWDADDHLDGLELVKALSHEHNYHHPQEENIPEEDLVHDPAQHTDAAERQRFRRVEKIVDKILDEDDSNYDGLVSFPEFMTAYHSSKLDGLKLRKVK